MDIISREETDIAPGWPRPAYRKEDGKLKPVQWIGGYASAQIMNCHTDKTYIAGLAFLCSCCGHQMVEGYFIDQSSIPGREATDPYNSHYGSPFCARCAVFATKVCPEFGRWSDNNELRWFELSSPEDYQEFDESAALELTEQGKSRPIVTTSDLVAKVKTGDLGITDETIQVPMKSHKRPPDYVADDELI